MIHDEAAANDDGTIVTTEIHAPGPSNVVPLTPWRVEIVSVPIVGLDECIAALTKPPPGPNGGSKP
jgi:hypothetical protein